MLSVTIIYSGFVTSIGKNLLKKACLVPHLHLKLHFLYIASTVKNCNIVYRTKYVHKVSLRLGSLAECLIKTFVILKVAELKKELADRGLSTKGNKSDLQARLEQCLSEQGECRNMCIKIYAVKI